MTRPPGRGRSVARAGRPGRPASVGIVALTWAAVGVSAIPGLAGCGTGDPQPVSPAVPGGGIDIRPAVDPAAPAARPDPDEAFASRMRQVPPPPRGLELYRPTPEDNRLSPERVELGRRLFFDARLSRHGTVACASCHRPELGFSDTIRFSPGVEGRTGTRTTPTLLNRAYGRAFFWDGRIGTLEEAVLQPIEDPVELDLPLGELAQRLERDADYRSAFEEAFPGEGISAGTIGRALASYVRVLLRGEAAGPGDGGRLLPPGALAVDDAGGAGARARHATSAEWVERGRELFLGRARCATCHAGPNLTLEEFHNTGVAGLSGDPGRYAVTGREEDRGRFKTPTLRGIRHTRPYMHDGSLPTLADVVEFYDRGGGPHPNRTPDLRPLGLTPEDLRSLVAFLESL